MRRAVEDGVFPGAVLMVRLAGKVVYQGAFGLAAREPVPESASSRTVYDLASLTKPLATAGVVLSLVQAGKLDLDAPVSRGLAELEGRPLARATIAHLLSHSAGLPAWLPFYQWVSARDRDEPGFLGSQAARNAVVAYVSEQPLAYPIGTRSLYSDLGFMLLGVLLERTTGESLQDLCQTRLFIRMGAQPLTFLPSGNHGARSPRELPSLDRALIAATEADPWRGRILRGEVHDENAYAMGGIAGHAGLFGDAAAVLSVSRCWVASYLGRGEIFDAQLARRFVTREERTPESSWALGWDTPSSGSSSGRYFSRRSFGHLGFTGTSLWIDPTREVEVVLLSNRVHPTRQNQAIQAFRPLIHDLVYEQLVGT